MNQRREYPGFWHAVLLCVTFVALQMFLTVPFVIVDALFKLRLATHPVAVGVVNLIACALVLLMSWLIGRPAMSEVCSLRRVSPLAVAGVIVASGGAIILLSEVDNLVRVVLPPPEWIVRLLGELSFSSEHVWASVFLLVIVAPLTEELMFRGLILRGFLRRCSVVGAFLLSSLMFAWWYARTQSLIPSLIGHGLANATVLGHQSLPLKIRGFNAGEPFGSTELQPFWFDALGVLLLVAGLRLFQRATPPIRGHAESSSQPPPPPVPLQSDAPSS